MKNSKNILLRQIKSIAQILFGCLSISLFNDHSVNAQCTSGVIQGQNLVSNGDFSQGYSGWTHDVGYTEFTPCASCYSVPGRIYAGSQASKFNGAFTDFNDHSPSTDGKMLLVDGTCTLGIPLWSQSGFVLTPNTSYYFEVWIASIKATAPLGTLRFDVDGNDLGTNITPSGSAGTWTLYSTIYTTGATVPASSKISIENTTTSGCETAVDFAIDDISFIPGCAFSTIGPIPNLGPDKTICGTTNLTLNAGVPTNGATTVTWVTPSGTSYTGTGTGAGGAPYNLGPGTSPVTTGATQLTPGTYTVCVKNGASCISTDVIVLSGTYSINLGPPITLCDPITATLDAGYTGPNVTYQWYKNSLANPDTIRNAKDKTYTLNTPGTYYVKVHDPVCGDQTASVVVSSLAATPVNATFCGTAKGGTGNASLSVTGSGKYKWFDTAGPTGGNTLAKGNSYNPTGLTGPGPYTFYVQDTTTFSGTVGPPATGNGFTNPANVSNNDGGTLKNKSALYFNAETDFRLDTLTVQPYVYYCPPSGVAYSFYISISDNAGNPLPGSPVIYDVMAAECLLGSPSTSRIKIPIGVSIPAGTGYQIKLTNNGALDSNPITMYLNTPSSGATPSPSLYPYPKTYSVAGNPVVSFATNDPQTFNLYNSVEAFPGFFDWKVTRGTNCERVPVIATELCPLPVTYVRFEATIVSGLIKLDWETALEKTSDYYSAERSEDGIHFSSLGTVKAAGNNHGLLAYSFTDRSPLQGISYYRIREVDIDGASSFTPTRSVTFQERDITVNPNPNHGSFKVSFKAGVGERVSLILVNTLGQSVYHNTATSSAEIFEKNIDIAFLSSGVYFLEILSDNNRWIKKIIKE